MSSKNERFDFSTRLQKELGRNGYSPDSPTQLARQFNARTHGSPVTVHAARKWLVGESIPTQEKLIEIANWLNVSPEWLRFGAGNNSAKKVSGKLQDEDIRLLADLKSLDEKGQVIARNFVRMLVTTNRSAA